MTDLAPADTSTRYTLTTSELGILKELKEDYDRDRTPFKTDCARWDGLLDYASPQNERDLHSLVAIGLVTWTKTGVIINFEGQKALHYNRITVTETGEPEFPFSTSDDGDLAYDTAPADRISASPTDADALIAEAAALITSRDSAHASGNRPLYRLSFIALAAIPHWMVIAAEKQLKAETRTAADATMGEVA